MPGTTGKTILLVDDEAIIAMGEARMLEKHGYAVLTAYSGEQAIETVTKESGIDLILMDIDLGRGMDGTQAAETILKTVDIPVLFLSSHTEPEVVDKTERITSHGYVVKNSGETVLLASIRMAFKLHKAHKELSKREEDLSKSERKLNFIFENTPNAITITEMETGTVIEANKGVEWTGWTRDEIIGKSPRLLQSWVNPDEGEKIRDIIRAEGKLSNHRVDFYKKDGSIAHALMSSVFIRINGKQCLLTVSNDITRLSESEVELLHERNFSQAALDSLPGLFYLVDSQGRYVRWNKNFAAATGYTDEEIRTMVPQDFFREPDRSVVAKKMEEVFNTGETEFEANVCSKNGDVRPYLITGKLFNFENRQCLAGMAIDITDRKRAEDAFKKSNERFSDLVRYLPETVYESDRQGIITFINQAGLDRFGYTREDINRGLNVINIIAPQDRKRAVENIDKTMRGERLGINQYLALKKDGTTFPMLVHSSAIIRDGHPEGLRGFLVDITERKQAEQALLEIESRYRSVINSIPIGIHIYRLETDGRLIFEGANPAADKILGVDNSVFIDKTIEEAFPALTATETPRRYRETAEKGIPWHTEEIDYDENSIRGAFDVHAFQIGDRRMAAAFIDITERKRADMALQESQQLLNTVYENVGAYIFMKDTAYRYTYANKKCCELFGRDISEIIGRPDDSFFSADSIPEILKSDSRVIEHGETVSREETNLASPEGTDRRTYWTVKIPLRDSAGAIYGLCGISTDITKLKRAEEALRESEDRWQFALEGAGDGIWDWNAETNRVYFSRQWKTMLGYGDNDIGDTLDEWESRLHPDDHDRVLAEINKHFDGKTPVYISEQRIRCRNGEYKWILDRGKVISRTPEGKPLRVIGTHTDISELKRNEEALGKAIAEKEALLRELQHRMKNSLAMITGIINLEMNRLNDTGLRDILDNIKGRIESLSNLYSLLFQSDTVREVELGVYMQSIVELLSGSYASGKRNIQIEQHYDPLRVTAKNAAAWGLIVNELLTNSFKYAFPQDRTGIIRIKLMKQGDEIILTVADNGKGLPKDFDIGNPPGLGLLLVKTLTQQLKGSLAFERGRANIFSIRVPGSSTG